MARGVELIKQYIDRCVESEEETFLLETAVFAEEFLAATQGTKMSSPPW